MVDTAPARPADALPHWDVAGSSRRWPLGSSLVAPRRWWPTSVGCATPSTSSAIRGGDPRPVTDADVAALDAVLPAVNELLERMRLVGAYLYAHISTDARDDDAARLQSAPGRQAPSGHADASGSRPGWPRSAWTSWSTRSTAGGRPRLRPAPGRTGRRPPDVRGGGGPGGRAGAHRRSGLGQAARRPHVPPHRRRAVPGRGRARRPADERGPGPGDRPRRRRAPGRLRRRAGGVGHRRGAAGHRAQRVQGRGQHAEPAAGLDRLARRRPGQQQRRPGHARRRCRRRSSTRCPTSPATTGPRPAARPPRRPAVVGPARPGRQRAAGSRGPRPPPRCADAFATYSPRLAGLVGPGGRRRLARRRATRRQGRRRLLHGRRRAR